MDNPMDGFGFRQVAVEPSRFQRVYDGIVAELAYIPLWRVWFATVDRDDVGIYDDTNLAVGAIEQSVAVRLEKEEI